MLATRSLIIRDAQTQEADKLSALAMRSKAYWGYSPQFMQQCRQELTVDASQIRNSQYAFKVAELEGALIGFYALLNQSEKIIALEALFVEPQYIGQGVGRALMDAAKSQAAQRGAKKIKVQSDPYAEAFYRAAGGIEIASQESVSVPGRYLKVYIIEL